jgi:hypothetical protein
MNITGYIPQTTEPNHALEPMRMLVTPRAYARVAPSTLMAQL